MLCGACGTDNPSQNRFCDQCGAPLEAVCPSCGGPVRPEARFCGTCGKRLGEAVAADGRAGRRRRRGVRGDPPLEYRSPVAAYTPRHLADKILRSRSALEGERRQVTVLFADIAGFTTLAEKLDPEDVHRIMDRCFELITAEVHRFEGTINQYTGDGVMALFGAPIAHEDGPRRAAHAALGIQRALRDYDRGAPGARAVFRLQMRIGLNTGPVVVGRIGDDLRMDYTAVGDTTNLAARLQQTARPGSVVVSEATHEPPSRLLRDARPGRARGEGARAGARVRGPARPRPPLAPRPRPWSAGSRRSWAASREVGILLERFAEVKRGRGQIVSLAGDAGIGKSRLLLEFRRAVMDGRRASHLAGGTVRLVRPVHSLPAAHRAAPGELSHRGVRRRARDHRQGRARHAPDGRARGAYPLRSLPAVGRSGRPQHPATWRQARGGEKSFEAIRALSLRGARLRPLVLVFEDLHWIDTSTEEYLASMADAVASVPLMLILTYRVGYTPPIPRAQLPHRAHAAPAVRGGRREPWPGSVLGAADLPPALRQALLDKAEGVPLFIEEVIKTLLDLGILRREGDGYRVVEGVGRPQRPRHHPGHHHGPPRPPGRGRQAHRAAGLGHRPAIPRAPAPAGRRAGGASSRVCSEELKDLEIIYELGLAPEPAYIFKHALIQDVAYQSLLKERRRELHRAVGLAIEEIYADRLAEHAEELAHHFRERWGLAEGLHLPRSVR